MKFFSIIALALCTTSALGKIHPQQECFPNQKSKLNLKELNPNPTWTEADAIVFLQKFKNLYDPIIAQMGKTLEIKIDWNIEEFNAGAVQRDGIFFINFEGGFIRTLEHEKDAIMYVACHEIGHHLAGFPFYGYGNTWASSEGQSDYYATHVCLPKLWENDLAANSRARTNVHPKVKEICDQTYRAINEQNICYRSAMAAYVKESTSARLSNHPLPDFNTPSNYIATQTRFNHPDYQCRIDTALNGATCKKEWDDTIIPGKNHPNGQNSKEAELIAANDSCHIDDPQPESMRPSCWFLTKLSPHLSNENIKLEDENNNGIFEQGEMLTVNIPLINDSVLELDQLDLKISAAGSNLLATNTYNNVPAHSQKYSDNLQSFSTSNWECGETAQLYNSFEHHGRTTTSLFEFKVGTPFTITTLSKVVNLQIPKNSQIEIPFENTINTRVGKVVVKVEIEEPTGSKLVGQLFRPVYTSSLFAGNFSSDDYKINPITTLNTINIDGSGSWLFKFKDLGSEGALSTVRRVTVELIGFNCN